MNAGAQVLISPISRTPRRRIYHFGYVRDARKKKRLLKKKKIFFFYYINLIFIRTIGNVRRANVIIILFYYYLHLSHFSPDDDVILFAVDVNACSSTNTGFFFLYRYVLLIGDRGNTIFCSLFHFSFWTTRNDSLQRSVKTCNV